jgi:hypothetical protein
MTFTKKNAKICFFIKSALTMDKFSDSLVRHEELKANIAHLTLKKQKLTQLMVDIRRSIEQTTGKDKDSQSYIEECEQILQDSSSFYDSLQTKLSIFNQELQECKNKSPNLASNHPN